MVRVEVVAEEVLLGLIKMAMLSEVGVAAEAAEVKEVVLYI